MLREAEIAVEELPEKVLKAAEQIESEDAKNYALPRFDRQKECLIHGIRKTFFKVTL